MLLTKRQRRKLCPPCPVARVADLLGDPCSLLIIRDLMAKPCRFGELQDSLAGMSSRTLTNKLKRLEKDKLIARHALTKPVRSYYRLTPKGTALNDVVKAMRSYGKKYL